jgi:hypothetical protein
MSNDKTYNGWSNYATWRVNLEFFDNYDLRDAYRDAPDALELADILKDEFLEYLESDCENRLTLSFARSFSEDVNYLEIAANLIEDAEFETEDEVEDRDDDETRVKNEVQ